MRIDRGRSGSAVGVQADKRDALDSGPGNIGRDGVHWALLGVVYV